MASIFRCEDTRCVCTDGWTGPRCENKDCDPRCSLHGQCKNGTCLCVTGWNGIHCTLEGCPNECSSQRQGICKTNFRGEWGCQCKAGWEGEDCSVQLEAYCDDGVDNDNGKDKNQVFLRYMYSTFNFFFVAKVSLTNTQLLEKVNNNFAFSHGQYSSALRADEVLVKLYTNEEEVKKCCSKMYEQSGRTYLSWKLHWPPELPYKKRRKVKSPFSRASWTELQTPLALLYILSLGWKTKVWCHFLMDRKDPLLRREEVFSTVIERNRITMRGEEVYFSLFFLL